MGWLIAIVTYYLAETKDIIKCDKDGAVLILPHTDPNHSDKYAVYHFRPHPTTKSTPIEKLGCGDVMTAVLALEFAKHHDAQQSGKQLEEHEKSNLILKSFKKANAVVACYRDQAWNRMPEFDAVTRFLENSDELMHDRYVDTSKGILFLPQKDTVILSQHECKIPSLYSTDYNFKRTIEKFVDNLNQWEANKQKSIILAAPSGCGKSTIIEKIENYISPRLNFDTIDFFKTKLNKREKNRQKIRELLESLVHTKSPKNRNLLIIVDECIKEIELRNYWNDFGMVMLDEAHKLGVRFLFVDAKFYPQVADSNLNSEFTSRCVNFYLSGLDARPADIPYLVASRVFVKKPSIHTFKIDNGVLLALTTEMLQDPNPRNLMQIVDHLLSKSDADNRSNDGLILKQLNLPRRFTAPIEMGPDDAIRTIEFSR